jgi:hypothetical protein
MGPDQISDQLIEAHAIACEYGGVAMFACVISDVDINGPADRGLKTINDASRRARLASLEAS